MEKKNIKAMPILSQKALANCKDLLVVDRDYNLDQARLVVPKGVSIDLKGGSINNGTIVFDDNLLENLSDGSIDARVVGTVQNAVIYTSQIGGINNLALSDYSGKTVYCDYAETNVNTTIILQGTNLNGSAETIFDGLNNSFPCSTTFFKFQSGAKNVTIRNFKATNNTTGGSPSSFVDSVSANADYTGINITGNQIKNFNNGISLNNDTQNYKVDNCLVSNNQLEDCLGTAPGSGYGIHMANVHHCTVSGNTLNNCQRHAIYNAYGSYNLIQNNHIINFRKDLSDYSPQAALDISRKSSHITVKNNTFARCNGVCIMIYTCTPAAETGDGSMTHLFRYGNCEDITIEDNIFTMGGLSGNLAGLSYIMVGYATESYTTRASANTLIINVEIKSNTFYKSGSDSQKCIRVDQCKVLKIADNTFNFKLPASPQYSTYRIINFTDSTTSDSVMTATVTGNTFTYNGTNTQAAIFIIGDDVSLFDSSVNPFYIIVWTANILQNQFSGSTTNYYLYEGTPGDNLIIT